MPGETSDRVGMFPPPGNELTLADALADVVDGALEDILDVGIRTRLQDATVRYRKSREWSVAVERLRAKLLSRGIGK